MKSVWTRHLERETVLSYLAEQQYRHGELNRIGVLLVNLGSPSAPTAAALRRYLAQFLSDPRVIEIPQPWWWLILHGLILRVRPTKSAQKYATVWTPAGAPLIVQSQRQALLFTGLLGERLKREGLPADLVLTRVAMRYGEPSIAEGLAGLRAGGCDRLLVLPLYPQYAASTTGSVSDAVGEALRRHRFVPAWRMARPFHDDAGYILALARRVNAYWERHGQPEHLLLSFHGLPKFSLDRGDPYHCHCHKTARLLTRELGLKDGQWTLTFQSRFGRAEWLQPYTAEVLRDLGKKRLKRLDVFCPGFVADCLETLEEIAMEGRQTFLDAGGGEFHYIPALNDLPEWIAALGGIAWRELAGWLDKPMPQSEREASRARALSLGAKQ